MVTWLTPHLFYVQMKSFEEECDAMMKRLQTFYQKRPAITQQVPIGSIVVVRQKSDGTFKRAKIVDYNPQLLKYRAQSIDYGNKVVCAQNELFELEKSFTKLPPLAISCSLIDVIRNTSREEILKLIDRYVGPTKSMSCEFVQRQDDVTLVKFSIDGVDLKAKMIEDGQLSEIPTGECKLHSDFVRGMFQREIIFQFLFQIFTSRVWPVKRFSSCPHPSRTSHASGRKYSAVTSL